MKISMLRFISFSFCVFWLSACSGPKTPQEVAEAFWASVIRGDAKSAAQYSTLKEAENFDGFSRSWNGFQPGWGRVVIEGDEASIVSEFERPAGEAMDSRTFDTYLVRRNGKWEVDYQRTADGMDGGALGKLFGRLNQLGNELSSQLQSSADDFSDEVERLNRELEDMSDALGEQAGESIEKYADELRRRIEELEESIDRALEDEEDGLTDRDRNILEEVSSDLEKDNERLSRPSVRSITETGRSMGGVRQRLLRVKSDDYGEEWRELMGKFEADVRTILEELSNDGSR